MFYLLVMSCGWAKKKIILSYDLLYVHGAQGETRTPTGVAHYPLKIACLPIPPPGRVNQQLGCCCEVAELLSLSAKKCLCGLDLFGKYFFVFLHFFCLSNKIEKRTCLYVLKIQEVKAYSFFAANGAGMKEDILRNQAYCRAVQNIIYKNP